MAQRRGQDHFYCPDYFRWSGHSGRGGGLSALPVFQTLQRLGAATTETIAEAMGRKPRALRTLLARLRDDDVAMYDPATGKWSLVADTLAATTRAAAKRGTLGTREWQRARHQQERRRYHEAMDALDQLRAQVTALAQEHRWKAVALNDKVIAAPGERAWRECIQRAGTRTLVRLRLALSAALRREVASTMRGNEAGCERARA